MQKIEIPCTIARRADKLYFVFANEIQAMEYAKYLPADAQFECFSGYYNALAIKI